MQVRRTVFGFEIEAPFDLATARLGEGSPLRVEIASEGLPLSGSPLLSWEPGPYNPINAKLTGDGSGGFLLEIVDGGQYRVQPNQGIITIPPGTPSLLRETRLLGLPLLLCFLHRGDLSLHAAAIEGPSGAILIAAPGRHGKTSLAAAFMKLGCRLLTEDLSCLTSNVPPTLIPGPASLRVRPDMAEHILPIPTMKQIGTVDDRTVLTTTDPGDCKPVPIAAILLLKDFGDSLSIAQAGAMGRLADLWLLSLHFPSEADRTRKFNQLVDLSNAVPVWEVTQPSDPARLVENARLILDSIG